MCIRDRVIVPEILPGMLSGFMLAVTLSIDDFAVTVFTIGNEGLETLSTYIYAVSYTHLDVYKRQGHDHFICHSYCHFSVLSHILLSDRT